MGMRGMCYCEFCGSLNGLRCYPADDPQSDDLHACAVCVVLIRAEQWDALVDRMIAAFAALQFMPEREQIAFRHELTNAVGAS